MNIVVLPDYVTKTAYERHNLRYIASDDIPAELQAIGWRSENMFKDLGDGKYYVVHAIYGPDTTGEVVCKRNDRVVIWDVDVEGDICKFKSEWVDHEITQKGNPCPEFFDVQGK